MEVARVLGVKREAVSECGGRDERVGDEQTMTEEVSLNQTECGLGDHRIEGDDRDTLKEPSYLGELDRVPATHDQFHGAHGTHADSRSRMLRRHEADGVGMTSLRVDQDVRVDQSAREAR